MNGADTTIYANLVSIMLSLGLMALVRKLKTKDAMEKRLFLLLLFLVFSMSIFYILCVYALTGDLPVGKTGALILYTVLEVLITLFAFDWFVYVDYRIFHSVDHLKRNMKVLTVPMILVVVFNVVNFFTGWLFWFDDALVAHVTDFYVICDLARLLYFIGSLVYLEIEKRKNKRLRFFSVKSFFIPWMFYVLLFYFTPYATAPLGLSIGLALIYVQNINSLCYQDTETGFYNLLYLQELRRRIEKGDYELSSAIMYTLPEGDRRQMAKLIDDQLPEDCDTIRCGRDTVVTLANVKEKAPLHMLSEDVDMGFEEAKIPVSVTYALKKKKESETEFLDRFLENA